MFSSERLKERRLSMGLTLEEVGEVVGISRSAVQKYEKKVIKNVYTSTVELFAKALHCTPAYLMCWTDDPLEGMKAEPSGYVLASDESLLVDRFRNLNNEGKEKAIDYLGDLVDTGKYKKRDTVGMVQEA